MSDSTTETKRGAKVYDAFCKRCDAVVPYYVASRKCVNCQRAGQKAYYHSHQDEISLAGKEYREKNREEIFYRKQRYREENREAIAAKKARYRAENREAIAAKKARYHAENREAIIARVKKWREDNPEKLAIQRAIDNSRRRARKLAAGGELSSLEWELILKYYGYQCLCCGVTRDLSIDHVIALANGGRHSRENVQVLCLSCNSSKGHWHSTDYRTESQLAQFEGWMSAQLDAILPDT
jgi:5-methylcytosine-specific restriction endonuclease McrA